MHNKETCHICKQSEMVKRIQSKLPEREAKEFRDFVNEYVNIEMDLNYHQAIMDGSWPSAVEQLTDALEKAKRIRHGEKHART